MPSAVSTTEIQELIDAVINSGDYTGAYDYLSVRGYAYADWANGVAQPA